MTYYEQYLAIGVVIPLISFAILAFFGHRIGKPLAGWVATGAIAASCVLSGIVLAGWMNLDPAAQAKLIDGAKRFHWADFGSMPITIGVKLDSLTIAMFFMVTFIATWIHVFSIGYMAGHSDEVDGVSKYHRFFAYLSLFCFSMLGLVVSSSLLFLFMFWELVGLCSYLLIGFYFDKKYASNAAMKAFITNRVGDFGFLAGMMLAVLYLGTFDLDQAAVTFEKASKDVGAAPLRSESVFAHQWLANTATPEQRQTVERFARSASGLWGHELLYVSFATLMGLGLFCGAIGKSAQVPLQVWLPDAMAGPTPVSALIHAATMVAAGVYLVARIFRLLTPEAQITIAVIGCITLTMAALIAIVQTDIKKILAYSTLSQLGYMIFGLGVGAWVAALFHLITHAFFKALMFLGSGQVIEGCHHEQDIRKMGGLHSKMPVTCYTFLVGVLAIAGFGIPATLLGGWSLGLGGYFSKDEILAVAYDRANNWPYEGIAEPTPEPGHGGPPRLRPPHAEVPTRAEHGIVAGAMMQAEHGAGGHEAAASEHGGAHHDAHATSKKLAIMRSMPTLPPWLFILPLIIAWITPFYMMRCWLLTFTGKPRDHHVHDHAHESPMMFVPLVVLAIGTFFSSYSLFRPMLVQAAPMATDAALVVGLDGVADQSQANSVAAGEWINLHSAHGFLTWAVGFSWAGGFFFAWLIYRNGLGLAQGFVGAPVFSSLHSLLVNKFYFDHLYEGILVPGMVLLAQACRGIFDRIVDGIVNLTAILTARFAQFTGRQLDMPIEPGDVGAVDALVNGVAEGVLYAGLGVRRPQSGRIRAYLMFASAMAALVLLFILFNAPIISAASRLVNWLWQNPVWLVAIIIAFLIAALLGSRARTNGKATAATA